MSAPDRALLEAELRFVRSEFDAALLLIRSARPESVNDRGYRVLVRDLAFVMQDPTILDLLVPGQESIGAESDLWSKVVVQGGSPSEWSSARDSAVRSLAREGVFARSARGQVTDVAVIATALARFHMSHGSIMAARAYSRRARTVDPEFALAWIASAEVANRRFDFPAEFVYLTRARSLTYGDERDYVERDMMKAYRMSVHFPTPESYIAENPDAFVR